VPAAGCRARTRHRVARESKPVSAEHGQGR
jgi:hypothetical protein